MGVTKSFNQGIYERERGGRQKERERGGCTIKHTASAIHIKADVQADT